VVITEFGIDSLMINDLFNICVVNDMDIGTCSETLVMFLVKDAFNLLILTSSQFELRHDPNVAKLGNLTKVRKFGK